MDFNDVWDRQSTTLWSTGLISRKVSFVTRHFVFRIVNLYIPYNISVSFENVEQSFIRFAKYNNSLDRCQIRKYRVLIFYHHHQHSLASEIWLFVYNCSSLTFETRNSVSKRHRSPIKTLKISPNTLNADVCVPYMGKNRDNGLENYTAIPRLHRYHEPLMKVSFIYPWGHCLRHRAHIDIISKPFSSH